jgi:hypothetical protein
MSDFVKPTWGACIVLVLLLAMTATQPASAQSTFVVEVEAGAAWQTRNNVQIPNDEVGTRFSLVDLAGRGPWASGRIYLTWNINEKHSIRGLAAPLSYTETGTLNDPVFFVDTLFEPGAPTEATYQFNSWRLTYRYRFHESENWTWWVGGTAKVRDAKIELRQGGLSAKDTDVGFVPLLHLAADWRFAEGWHGILDLDALAGGPGRAIDLGLKIGYDLSDRWTVTAGYRMVEGGADTDDVYNFAWFQSAVFSGIYRF